MDRLSKKARSVLMSSVRTSGTDIEQGLVRCVRVVRDRGRYHRNVKTLPGKPDIVFDKYKIAIFADGDFWHGKDFIRKHSQLTPFWRKKIKLNILRDRRDNAALRRRGYKVLRFWGSVIKKNSDKVSEKIVSLLDKN